MARRGLRGHAGSVGYLLIDAARSTVISGSRFELRVWNLDASLSRLVSPMPCTVLHVERSPDARQAALDCNDGSVWLWSRDTGAVKPIQRHTGYAYGLRWFRGQICSSGMGDGQIVCSRADGTESQHLDGGHPHIWSLSTLPRDEALLFGSGDGKIWRFDGQLRSLYAQHAGFVALAVSEDGELLASCAEDGALAVFDLARARVVTSLLAHAGRRCDVAWSGGELWSHGGDGTLKRWRASRSELRLKHMVRASGGLSLAIVRRGGWAAVEGTSTLLVSRDGVAIALRLDVGRIVTGVDVSADQRYVAASSRGEIIVVDLARKAVATLATGAPVQQVTFLEPGLLAFSEPTALKTLRVEQLAYVPYEETPEPRNRASF